jgi:competence protein ComEA
MEKRIVIRRIVAVILLLLLNFSLQSCGREEAIYIEQGESVFSETEQEDSLMPEESGTETLSEQNISNPEAPEKIFVYVCGAVAQAGVYELPAGARIYEALDSAGGFLEEACPEAVNLAEEVYDAQMIWIPTVSEAMEGGLLPSSGVQDVAQDSTLTEADQRVNLNTATAEMLMTLPGIGQSKADSIIAYRNSHGEFASVEDIMNVDGIKEGVYNRIKDNIKVK